ncbi:MAG: hypothetical protein M3Q47_13320 [Actinomycetota bacterium]|nr:hypothetical protein [Actinomycetota bacterium]
MTIAGRRAEVALVLDGSYEYWVYSDATVTDGGRRMSASGACDGWQDMP